MRQFICITNNTKQTRTRKPETDMRNIMPRELLWKKCVFYSNK